MRSAVGGRSMRGSPAVPVPSRLLIEPVAAAAAGSPSATAIQVPAEPPVTYGELMQRVGEARSRLEALGLAEAGRVALVAPATPDTLVALLALSQIATVVPLNPANTRDEYRSYLAASQVSAVVVQRDDAGPREAAEQLGIRVVGAAWSDSTRQRGSGAGPKNANGDRPALLFQTSGTTARPKNVPLSHRNVLVGASNVVRALDLTAADSCLLMMPLFHVHGLIGCALATLTSGGRLILASAPRAIDAFAWVTSLAPSWYSGSPAVHHAMVRRANAVGVRPRNTLRLIRSCSAPLPWTLLEQLRATFGAPIVNAYGMTEASHQIASTSLNGCEREGDVGIPIGCEVVVRRESGLRADPDETGEIWVRGDNVFAGYEPSDSSIDADSWLNTGDLGTIDRRGRLCLQGRVKELINKGGEKISPAEIDAVFLRFPEIIEAAAFGVPDGRLGEDVAAAVVLRSGSRVTPEELQARSAIHVASFKVPSRVIVVDRLPRGATGKVLRRVLAGSLASGTQQAVAEPPTAAPWSIEDALLELWKDVLQLRHVELDDDFFELGGDSLSAADLVLRVSERFGTEPSLTSFFAAPTIGEMARSIRAKEVAPRGTARALAALRPQGTEPPLFFAHGTNFSVDHYRPLVRHLRPGIPVFGVQEDLFRSPPYVPSDLPALARHYADVTRSVQPHGPYRLGGYSSAGVIAAEIARVLRAAGEEVERLILVDAYPLWLRGTPRWLAFRLRMLRRLPPGSALGWAAQAIRARLARARSAAAARRSDVGGPTAERISRLSSHLHHIVHDSRPQALDVPVAFIVTAEAQALWGDPFLGWATVAPMLEKIVVPGSHLTVLDEPHVKEVAAALNRLL